MHPLLTRSLAAASIGMLVVMTAPVVGDVAIANEANGVVTTDSHYNLEETINRIKQDVAAKGIMFFAQIDQAKLGNDAGNQVMPSTLLLFGNPALGTTFITSNPEAGLDWPVRVLVFQSADGKVHVSYNDFTWTAARHGITNRQEQFAMATMVIRSIISTVEQ